MNVDEFLKRDINRRQFLGRSAQNAAGVAAGMVGFAGAATRAAPNERVRVGVIGVRNRGKVLATRLAAFNDVDVITVCDVDRRVLADAIQAIEAVQGVRPDVERDFRRLLDDRTIDAIVIATPDHWHALMFLNACQVGKDVYVEKPVSHTIAEAMQMMTVTAATGRVVQTGLQQRSALHFQSAVAFVKSGKLGPVRFAKAWTVHHRKSIGCRSERDAPDGVDYDFWLGPAPHRPFQPNRFHHNWHWFWDYGTGELGNWGVHMLDVARWGLEVDFPTRIAAAGGKYCFQDDQETPDTLAVQFSYPGKTVIWEHRQWSPHGIEGRSAGVAFYGEKGTLIVDRGGWKVYDCNEAHISDTSEQLEPHLRDFVDCVKSRQTPAADIATGAVSTVLCHLGNIAYRVGREVHFDPAAMNFGTDAEANALLHGTYRPPWPLPHGESQRSV